MKGFWTKGRIFFLLLLFLVFFLLNLSWVWRWMYPVYYPEIIKKASEQYQLNPHLILAIIQTESKFLHHKTSKKGAIGLMQIMNDTAEWILERSGYAKNATQSLQEPEINIELGSWYLRYLLDLYDGNLIAALAAYNAGQGNVTRWLKTGVWDGNYSTINQIPYGETRHYIQRVIYNFERYNEVYGDDYWYSIGFTSHLNHLDVKFFMLINTCTNVFFSKFQLQNMIYLL
jgi:soluble lytic murein transglycosylase